MKSTTWREGHTVLKRLPASAGGSEEGKEGWFKLCVEHPKISSLGQREGFKRTKNIFAEEKRKHPPSTPNLITQNIEVSSHWPHSWVWDALYTVMVSAQRTFTSFLCIFISTNPRRTAPAHTLQAQMPSTDISHVLHGKVRFLLWKLQLGSPAQAGAETARWCCKHSSARGFDTKSRATSLARQKICPGHPGEAAHHCSRTGTTSYITGYTTGYWLHRRGELERAHCPRQGHSTNERGRLATARCVTLLHRLTPTEVSPSRARFSPAPIPCAHRTSLTDVISWLKNTARLSPLP